MRVSSQPQNALRGADSASAIYGCPSLVSLSSPITSCRVGRNVYGGTSQVHRRRRALEHAAGEVELRAVAGAEEAARPVGAHLGLASARACHFGEQPRCVHTPTSTRTPASRERYSFFAYFGCSDAFDSRIGETRHRLLCSDSSISGVRRRHPDRLAAPLDDAELARLRSWRRRPRRARRQRGALRRPHARNEGHRGRDRGDAAGGGGRDHERCAASYLLFLDRSWRWRCCEAAAGKRESRRF